jgi:hypothetical protein
LDLKKLLVPEEAVTLSLLDLFDELQEKKTEFTRMHLNDFFADSYCNQARSSSLSLQDKDKKNSFFALCDKTYIPSIRGIPMVNLKPAMSYFAQTNTCNRCSPSSPFVEGCPDN